MALQEAMSKVVAASEVDIKVKAETNVDGSATDSIDVDGDVDGRAGRSETVDSENSVPSPPMTVRINALQRKTALLVRALAALGNAFECNSELASHFLLIGSSIHRRVDRGNTALQQAMVRIKQQVRGVVAESRAYSNTSKGGDIEVVGEEREKTEQSESVVENTLGPLQRSWGGTVESIAAVEQLSVAVEVEGAFQNANFIVHEVRHNVMLEQRNEDTCTNNSDDEGSTSDGGGLKGVCSGTTSDSVAPLVPVHATHSHHMGVRVAASCERMVDGLLILRVMLQDAAREQHTALRKMLRGATELFESTRELETFRCEERRLLSSASSVSSLLSSSSRVNGSSRRSSGGRIFKRIRKRQRQARRQQSSLVEVPTSVVAAWAKAARVRALCEARDDVVQVRVGFAYDWVGTSLHIASTRSEGTLMPCVLAMRRRTCILNFIVYITH